MTASPGPALVVVDVQAGFDHPSWGPTTARVAGNLGYDTTFVIDATHTFDRPGLDGVMIPADHLAAVTAANLHGEFAEVTTTGALVDRLGQE